MIRTSDRTVRGRKIRTAWCTAERSADLVETSVHSHDTMNDGSTHLVQPPANRSGHGLDLMANLRCAKGAWAREFLSPWEAPEIHP